MRGFVFRFLLIAAAVLITERVLPGVEVENAGALFLAALVLGVLNVSLRPLLVFLTLPLTIFTLGLFVFVINALILYLTSLLVPGFRVDGFFNALLASVMISLVSAGINWLARG